MVEKYTEKWFVDTMRYLDIDISDIDSARDLRDKMAKARWKRGARWDRPQTKGIQSKLIDFWAQRIQPLRQQATIIEEERIRKVKGGYKVDIEKDVYIVKNKKDLPKRARDTIK